MSIQEHLNKIRNAVKGSEVRESIAKGIETAYDDASENGNANMEVRLARGTHPNLRSRLEEVDNKQQQTTAQLAQTARKDEVRLKSVKNELEDMSPTVLAAIEGGEGTSFNLLSIPQEKSVGVKETKYPMVEGEPSRNLFDGEWEMGNWRVTNGEPANSTTHQRTLSYIPVDINKKYVLSKSNSLAGSIHLYDENKNWLGRIAYGGTHSIFNDVTPFLEGTAFVRFHSDLGTEPNVNDFSKWQFEQGSTPTELVSHYPKLKEGSVAFEQLGDFKNVLTSELSNWRLGTILNTTGLIADATNRITTPELIYFNEGDFFEVKHEYEYLVSKYTEDDVWEWITLWNESTTSYTFSESGYYRLVIRKKDSSDLTDVIQETANSLQVFMNEKIVKNRNIGKGSLNVDRFDESFEIRAQETLSYTSTAFPQRLFTLPIISSDVTFVGDELWGFGISNDEGTNFGHVRRYAIDFDNGTHEEVSRFKHNWGHLNTVDYREHNDSLIFGNGGQSFELPGKFFIVPNTSLLTDVEIDVEIELHDVAIEFDCSQYDFGYKLQAIWGESNRDEHNIAYLISNDNRTFRRILLGKGDNQLELGSFLSNKNSNEFNGTFKVLNVYEHDVQEQNNGSCFYNGNLYCGGSHTGLTFTKYTPLENGSVLHEKRVERVYDSKGNDISSSYYTNGIARKGKYLLIAGYQELGVYEYYD